MRSFLIYIGVFVSGFAYSQDESLKSVSVSVFTPTASTSSTTTDNSSRSQTSSVFTGTVSESTNGDYKSSQKKSNVSEDVNSNGANGRKPKKGKKNE